MNIKLSNLCPLLHHVFSKFTVIGNAHNNNDRLLPINRDNVPNNITPKAAPECEICLVGFLHFL